MNTLFPTLNYIKGAMKPYVWSGIPEFQETYNFETNSLEIRPQWGEKAHLTPSLAIVYAKGMKWIPDEWKYHERKN